MRTRKREAHDYSYNEDKLELLVGDHAGIYIPQEFINSVNIRDWHIDRKDAEIVQAGPDHDLYWDAWTDIEDEAWYKDRQGMKWTLYLSGDLWAVREDADWDLLESKKRETITLQDEVRIPGTNVILEKGDVIEILPKREQEEPKDDEKDDEEEMDEKGDYKKKKKESLRRRPKTIKREALKRLKEKK